MRKKIAECLIQAGLITEDELRQALAEQQRTGERVGAILVRLNLVSAKQITKALAYQAGCAYVSLSDDPPDRAAIRIIPKTLALTRECVAIKLDHGVLTVAVCDPVDASAVEELERHTGYRIRRVVATRAEVLEWIGNGYVERVDELGAQAHADAAARQPEPPEFSTQTGAEPQPAETNVAAARDRALIVDIVELVLNNRQLLYQAIEESQQAGDPDRLTIGEVKRITANLHGLVAGRRGEGAALDAVVSSRVDGELDLVPSGIVAAEDLLRVLSRFRERASPCSNCGTEVAVDFNVCPYCAHRLRDGCIRCARPLDPEWNFCPDCAAAATPQKRRGHKERTSLETPPSNIAEFKNQNR